MSHVKRLVESGLKPADIAVIAPYNLQVSNLSFRYGCILQFYTAGEVSLVVSHVNRLIECGLKPINIAVTAPCNLQFGRTPGPSCSKHR